MYPSQEAALETGAAARESPAACLQGRTAGKGMCAASQVLVVWMLCLSLGGAATGGSNVDGANQQQLFQALTVANFRLWLNLRGEPGVLAVRDS